MIQHQAKVDLIKSAVRSFTAVSTDATLRSALHLQPGKLDLAQGSRNFSDRAADLAFRHSVPKAASVPPNVFLGHNMTLWKRSYGRCDIEKARAMASHPNQGSRTRRNGHLKGRSSRVGTLETLDGPCAGGLPTFLRDVAEETRTWPKFYPSTRQQTGSKSFILRMRNVLMKYSPRYQLKKRLNLP